LWFLLKKEKYIKISLSKSISENNKNNASFVTIKKGVETSKTHEDAVIVFKNSSEIPNKSGSPEVKCHRDLPNLKSGVTKIDNENNLSEFESLSDNNKAEKDPNDSKTDSSPKQKDTIKSTLNLQSNTAQTMTQTFKHNFKCKLCDLKFCKLSAVKTHVEINHLNIQQFQCGFCSVKFLRKNHLLEHSRNKHNKPPSIVFMDDNTALEHIDKLTGKSSNKKLILPIRLNIYGRVFESHQERSLSYHIRSLIFRRF